MANPQCPNCKSYKTNYKGGAIMAFSKALILGSCLFWFGLLFWPVMILSVIVFCLSPFVAMASKGGGGDQVCKNCAHTWKMYL